MERIVMTWGFIPSECVSETIFCGDEEDDEIYDEKVCVGTL